MLIYKSVQVYAIICIISIQVLQFVTLKYSQILISSNVYHFFIGNYPKSFVLYFVKDVSTLLLPMVILLQNSSRNSFHLPQGDSSL